MKTLRQMLHVDRHRYSSAMNACDVYWGSHGCDLDRKHRGKHWCDIAQCDSRGYGFWWADWFGADTTWIERAHVRLVRPVQRVRIKLHTRRIRAARAADKKAA